MELKAFIKSSIIDIMGAIHESQMEWKATIGKGAINPVWDDTSKLSKHVQIVEFDIAVSAAERVGASGASGIQVVEAEIGAGDHFERERTGVSRIKFKVPVVAPVDIVIGGNNI